MQGQGQVKGQKYVFSELLPIETGLLTVERPNSPKTLLYSRKSSLEEYYA